jgi:hypothetical protein
VAVEKGVVSYSEVILEGLSEVRWKVLTVDID